MLATLITQKQTHATFDNTATNTKVSNQSNDQSNDQSNGLVHTERANVKEASEARHLKESK